MASLRNKVSSWLAAVRRDVVRLRSDRRGNVTILAGLLIVPLVGAMGVGFEITNWYMTKRAMQNAADAAVIAASANGGSNYATEAKAVAAQYGFVDGSNNVTVTASNTAACPGGGNTCYSVTITDAVPLYLSQVVGFAGNTKIGSAAANSLNSSAVATQGATPVQLCILALASSGTDPAIRTNGAPKADLAGCDIQSNTGSTCNGSNLNANHGLAVKTNNGCGVTQVSNAKAVSDPYSYLSSNIPANTCASYPQEPGKKGPALPASNQLSGTYNWSGNVIKCGDVQLTGNVTINTSGSGAVLVIYNGRLDSNGYTLQSAGSGLTVVFSGTNSSSYTYAPTGGGTFDIFAPTSGSSWSGVAIYQDPKLTTSGVNVSFAGNSPTWNITGLIYMPHASATFSGAINKSSNGHACFVLVVDNILINGTADILKDEGECNAAGLSMPTNSIPGRGQLVL
jgi:Flp pilus assembly protein TadG